MRGLNLLKKNKVADVWRNHQLESITVATNDIISNSSEIIVPTIEPLIPGSYLCNQIVFLPDQTGVLPIDFKPAEVSLDTVYESLSFSAHSSVNSAILVDCLTLDNESSEHLFDVVCRLRQRFDNLNTLVVLQRSHLQRIKLLFESSPLNVRYIKPKWDVAGHVLSLYRNARHCVFIDTHRVVDAALCDCPLTLIASSGFVGALKTDALSRCLEIYSKAHIIGLAGTVETSQQSTVKISENRMSDFQTLLTGETPVVGCDWLDEYQLPPEHNRPVIGSYLSRWQKPAQNVSDMRISFRRKTLKLQEDPRQFCADSNNPVIRKLANLFPSRDAA